MKACVWNATEPIARWTMAGDGRHHPDEPPDAVLTGPAPTLLLLLWGRVGLDDPRLQASFVAWQEKGLDSLP